MLEPWNDKSVLPPPVNTYLSQGLDVKHLKQICNSILHVLSKQSPLHKESAILSRFVYKYDKKFRTDIGYRYLKKVNSALRKYLGLAIIKVVQNFVDVLPTTNDRKNYVPTRQMLEYVLVRLITFSKIMIRIIQSSKQAAIFYLNRIKKGESHWMCLMPYALLSRMWSMGLVLIQHSCKWYNQLYPFLNNLEHKGLNFLPSEYALPSDLENFNDMKNLNDAGRLEWSQKTTVDFNMLIDEDNEGELCDSILKFVDKINKNNKDDESDTQSLISGHDRAIKAAQIDTTVYEKDDEGTLLSRENFTKVFKAPEFDATVVQKDDQGEAISRDSFRNFMDNLPPILFNPSVEKIRQDHSFQNVIDRDSLKEFIDNEEKFRNTSDIKSLTDHLSFMQWQSLKNGLLKFDNELVNKHKLQLKVRKLWKEKCLDCL